MRKKLPPQSEINLNAREMTLAFMKERYNIVGNGRPSKKDFSHSYFCNSCRLFNLSEEAYQRHCELIHHAVRL